MLCDVMNIYCMVKRFHTCSTPASRLHILTLEKDGWIFRDVEQMKWGINGHHPTEQQAIETAKSFGTVFEAE